MQMINDKISIHLEAPATTTSNSYSSYDAALYSAATMYVAQQTKPNNG